MCKQNYNAWRMVGKDLAVVNLGTGDQPTEVQADANNGDIIGFSVAENYSRTIMSKTLLSIEVEGDKPFVNVPLTQLLPDGERQMWPLQVPIKKGLKLKCVLTCRDNTMVTANPIVLIFHHTALENCK